MQAGHEVLEPGAMVAGYTVEGVLGSGSSADVYLVTDRSGALFALKSLHGRDLGGGFHGGLDGRIHGGLGPGMDADRLRDRFVREFEIASLLRHPNIVATHDTGEIVHENGTRTPWMVMQYAAGPVSTALVPTPRIHPDPATISRIVCQTAAALDHAHAHEVIHRDVKPSNILLTSTDLPVADALLSDFGIAQFLDDARPLARNGRVKGSVAYAAPELLTAQRLSEATDQYALACSVVEWLTGEPPYPRETSFAITNAHLRADPPRLSRRRDWLPSSLDSVFAKALAKDPSRRYDSCAEFAGIIAHTLRDVTPPEPPSRRRAFGLFGGD